MLRKGLESCLFRETGPIKDEAYVFCLVEEDIECHVDGNPSVMFFVSNCGRLPGELGRCGHVTSFNHKT